MLPELLDMVDEMDGTINDNVPEPTRSVFQRIKRLLNPFRRFRRRIVNVYQRRGRNTQ